MSVGAPDGEPPIVCEFLRGTHTWRYVFGRRDAHGAIEIAIESVRKGELDRFDLELLGLLIENAMKSGGTRVTTITQPITSDTHASKQRPTSRKPWNKD